MGFKNWSIILNYSFQNEQEVYMDTIIPVRVSYFTKFVCFEMGMAWFGKGDNTRLCTNKDLAIFGSKANETLCLWTFLLKGTVWNLAKLA